MGIKRMIKNWLGIEPAPGASIVIYEPLSFEANCMRNRILYRGDPSEIDQFFKQAKETRAQGDSVADARFWAAVPSKGLQIRKIHSGLPGMIVNTLANVVVTDMLDVEVTKPDKKYADTWGEIAEENDLKELLYDTVQQLLTVGDGAFKISYDPALSKLPILEFYAGERVKYLLNRGRVQETQFLTRYKVRDRSYLLTEYYGMNYIKYILTNDKEEPVDLSTLPETADLMDVTFEGDFMMAVPCMIFKSPKWPGRGRSIYDLKVDAFDALDETISQWQDAMRLGRIKRYIPATLLPRNPDTGAVITPSPFDNQYIAVKGSLAEGSKEQIITDQPTVNYDGFVTTYVNNLDICLQGLISPSTLGIDTKKLDNAEAQREKEKTTLYTRAQIVSVMQKTVEELVTATLKAHMIRTGKSVQEVECNIEFGEYANPSFEAQIETVGKAATAQIMSINAQIDTLWGDTKDDDWKAEEVTRIKNERGIAEIAEPSVVPHGFAKEKIDGPDYLDLPRDGKVLDGRDDSKPEAPRSVGG